MNKQEFIIQLAEYCEFENNNYALNTSLKSIEGYDSLAIMAIIAFVDENFSVKLSSQQLQNISDFNSLIAIIGENRFEDD